MNNMDRQAVEGVIGHEVAHVANGDMVTMTLLQGVVNAFVMFLSRVLAFAIAQALRGDRDDRERGGGMSSMAYYGISMVLEIVFMILGSLVVAAFSRYREYRADAGGARLAGRERMVAALEKLRRTYEIADDGTRPAVAAFKISGGKKSWLQAFASHPPLEDRIARLREARG
jgi:heat shock protein HtpX